MNDGKTQAFFQWAATGAWVPPLYFNNYTTVPQNLSYANRTAPAPRLAHHDPIHVHQDLLTGNPSPWVRPDFIIKADDDSFIMLAELEARLRVQLHGGPLPRHYTAPPAPLLVAPPATPGQSTIYHPPNDDPLIYWGYQVKNRFMAGELYALSHSLVDWISNDPTVRDYARGAEDQITAFWIKWHPRAQDVRWIRERCWVYDHPKSGTVYVDSRLPLTNPYRGTDVNFAGTPEVSSSHRRQNACRRRSWMILTGGRKRRRTRSGHKASRKATLKCSAPVASHRHHGYCLPSPRSVFDMHRRCRTCLSITASRHS